MVSVNMPTVTALLTLMPPGGAKSGKRRRRDVKGTDVKVVFEGNNDELYGFSQEGVDWSIIAGVCLFGVSVAKVAGLFGYSKAAVYDRVHKFRTHGQATGVLPGRGRPQALTEEEVDEAAEALQRLKHPRLNDVCDFSRAWDKNQMRIRSSLSNFPLSFERSFTFFNGDSDDRDTEVNRNL